MYAIVLYFVLMNRIQKFDEGVNCKGRIVHGYGLYDAGFIRLIGGR